MSFRLSPQQSRVFDLLEKGLLVKEIGAELSISENTVKKHLQKLYRKLGAQSARQAIHFCRIGVTREARSGQNPHLTGQ